MQIEILTWEDLLRFKAELIKELRIIIQQEEVTNVQWLRSAEVRKLLKISPGTLQNLRIKGAIPYQKIGNIFYYAYSDISYLLNKIGKP